MSLSRSSTLLILSLFLAACGARSFGGPPDDGGAPADGNVPLDGLVYFHDTYGYVTVAHIQDSDSQYGHESLQLRAAFYPEPWDLEAPYAGWPEPTRLETPDGVTCELRYISGMDGPIPPDPPEQLDGGEIYAWAGFDGDDVLEVFFDGYAYDSDYRSPDSAAGWPLWMGDGALALQLEITGSASSPPVFREVFLSEMPVILAPPISLDEPLTPDPDGNHSISWIPVDADRLEVHFTFNMDWDDSYFRCYPAAGAISMRLPHEWLEQYSWGFGQMMLFAWNDQIAQEEDTVVTLRTVRIQQRSLNILVWD